MIKIKKEDIEIINKAINKVNYKYNIENNKCELEELICLIRDLTELVEYEEEEKNELKDDIYEYGLNYPKEYYE